MLVLSLMLVGLAQAADRTSSAVDLDGSRTTAAGRPKETQACFVMGIKEDDHLEYINNMGEDRQPMDGTLVYAAATGNVIWGINAAGKIYKRRDMQKWEMVPAPSNPTSIAAIGARVWITLKNGDIYKYKDGEWKKVSNGGKDAKQVALSHDMAWMIDTSGAISYAPLGTGKLEWKTISGNLKQMSVWGDHVWGVNSNDDIYKMKFDRKTGSGKWEAVKGKLKELSVATGQVFGVNSAGDVYRMPMGGEWKKYGDGGYKFVASNGFCVPKENLEDMDECFIDGKSFKGDLLTTLEDIESPQKCMKKCLKRDHCKAMTWRGYELACDLYRHKDDEMQNSPYWMHMVSGSTNKCDASRFVIEDSMEPVRSEDAPAQPATYNGGQSMADRSLCWENDIKLSGGANVDVGGCEPRYTTKGCTCKKEWYDDYWGHYETNYCVNSAQGEYCYTQGMCQGSNWGWCKPCNGGDSGPITVKSMADCVSECTNYQSCNYASYHGAKKKCFLKKKYNSRDSQDEEQAWVSGPVKCNKCYADGYRYKKTTWKTFENINNYDACRYKCDYYQPCKYFAWHSGKKWCELYKELDVEKRTTSKKVITAKRGCRVNPNDLRALEVTDDFLFNGAIVAAAIGVSAVAAFGLLYTLRLKSKSQVVETDGEAPSAPLLA